MLSSEFHLKPLNVKGYRLSKKTLIFIFVCDTNHRPVDDRVTR